MTALAPTLQAFFVERLLGQRGASPHTVAAYRDTLRLLLGFAAARTRKAPALLDLGDLDGPLVAAFLDHLERERGNGTRTRNHRLAAIHSLFAYAARRHPEHAASIARVLAIPTKRFERTLITYLTDAEVDALLAACDRATWAGRRDHALLTLTVGTGLRISELAGLACADVSLGRGAHVHCVGKGRKERRTPLVPVVADTLRVWLAERAGSPSDPLFPARSGGTLSRDAIEHRIARCAARAAERCPSLQAKHVTAHVLRHTTAMRLLLAGVDVSVIALWLGHEQIATTGVYLEADLATKERAIARVAPPGTTPGRYRAPDQLLAFLEGL